MDLGRQVAVSASHVNEISPVVVQKKKKNTLLSSHHVTDAEDLKMGGTESSPEDSKGSPWAGVAGMRGTVGHGGE